MASCDAHPFEVATAVCRSCRYDYCAECLVYTFGPKKPPYCIPCALKVAGVRTTATRAPARRRTGSEQRAERAAAGHEAATELDEDRTPAREAVRERAVAETGSSRRILTTAIAATAAGIAAVPVVISIL